PVQIRDHLQRKAPSDWVRFEQRIQNTHNLPELAATPLFLDMILESLTAEFEAVEGNINSAKLYSLYSERWFSESLVRHGATLSRSRKKALVLDIAVHMYLNDRFLVTADELQDKITEYLECDRASDIEAALNDITNCSFLTRDGDYFKFSHLSF